MAEADPDSVDLKAPLFSFFVGFGTKGTPDSDAGRSPTSPLDFANFGGLFSPRSSPHRNKWFSHKVGLSVLSSTEAHCDSFSRDNVVLAPQIKVNVHTTANLSTQVFDQSNSLPAVNIHTSPRRSSSSPMDIISSQAYSRSLSGREMALSEDYTCIISHGPNPKTTHIFGDCILDCDPKDLGDTKEGGSFTGGDCHKIHFHREKESENAGVEDSLEISPGSSYNEDISREKESENAGVEDSLEISPGSSYNEDLFPMPMPLKPSP